MIPVYLANWNGTLVRGDIGRDLFLKARPDIYRGWNNNEFPSLDAVANALVHIRNYEPGNNIGVKPYDETLRWLHEWRQQGIEVQVYSSGNDELIQKGLVASELPIKKYFTTWNYNSDLKKRTNDFVSISGKLRENGRQLAAYFDDSVQNIVSAYFASLIVGGNEPAWKTYLVHPKGAERDGIGKTVYGFYIIRSFDDVETIEQEEAAGREVSSVHRCGQADERFEKAGLETMVEKESAAAEEEGAKESETESSDSEAA